MLEHHDHGPIRTLRLARPPVNALHVPMFEALGAAIAAAPREGARGLVLTGGGKLFSAGLDVSVLASLDAPALNHFLASFFTCLRTMAESTIPICTAFTRTPATSNTVNR